MPPYERNSIQAADLIGREAIFASFMCEEDNTYDYLLLEDIPKVVITPIRIDFINKTTCTQDGREITFSCEYDKNVDPINIKVSAILNDHKASPVLIEIQDFTDALCSTVYDNKAFEEHEMIDDIKRRAINNLMEECFIHTGEIAVNRSYNVVGRIVNNDNDVVGIINSFDVAIDINDKLIVGLKEVIAYVPLKELSVSKIEFFTSHYVFVINDFDIKESTEGIVKQYRIQVRNCYSQPSNEPIIAETNTNIVDYDFFFDEREQLLSAKEKLFNSTVDDSISELFGDFEF